MNDIVILISKYLKLNHGIDAQPIETNYVHAYTNSNKILYKARMIFLKTGGFPYGFSILADVLMSPEPTLVGI